MKIVMRARPIISPKSYVPGDKIWVQETAESLVADCFRDFELRNRLGCCFDCLCLKPFLLPIMGTGGYRRLILESLALAQQDSPWLINIRLKPDGSFEEPNMALEINSHEDFEEGLILVVTCIFELLVKYVGLQSTQSVVQDARRQVLYGINNKETLQ